MGATPKTRYTKTVDDVTIAYQVLGGDGPDLLVSYGFISNIELLWDYPPWAALVEGLARFTRLIHFDKRGVGLSDRGVGFPSVAERVDDLAAVLDAAGSESAHLFGSSEGGPLTMQYAAMRPERVASLALYGSFARAVASEDYPIGVHPAMMRAFADGVEQTWGRPEAINLYRLFDPDFEETEEAAEDILRMNRRSASPHEAGDAMRRVCDIDVRSVLGSIQAPTLVIHRTGDVVCPIAMGRYLADHIPAARFRELPGANHTVWAGETEELISVVEEWVTGAPSTPKSHLDRVLSTVLFTDIVGSTERAASLGDDRWSRLLDHHDSIVDRELARFHGERVKSTGDGMLATFDGPGRGVRCAQAITSSLRPLGIDVRAGLHVGEVERRQGDIGGIAVHIGARVASLAGPGEVLVSSTVRDLVAGSDLRFADRGEHELKGVPGTWRLLAAVPS